MRRLQQEASSENYPLFKHFNILSDLKALERIVTSGSLLQETSGPGACAELVAPRKYHTSKAHLIVLLRCENVLEIVLGSEDRRLVIASFALRESYKKRLGYNLCQRPNFQLLHTESNKLNSSTHSRRTHAISLGSILTQLALTHLHIHDHSERLLSSCSIAVSMNCGLSQRRSAGAPTAHMSTSLAVEKRKWKGERKGDPNMARCSRSARVRIGY